MAMIRNIIWDVDGTLFDTYPAIAGAVKTALNDLGCDAPLDWITGLTKITLNHCITTLTETYPLTGEAIRERYEMHYAGILLEEQRPMPGVVPICEYIWANGGKNVIVTHRGRESTVGLLSTHHLIDYFAGWITQDDGYPRKPDPAAFVAAIRAYGLKREDTITVGDRDIDIEAGQAAGLFSCLFDFENSKVRPDLTITTFETLYDYIRANQVE